MVPFVRMSMNSESTSARWSYSASRRPIRAHAQACPPEHRLPFRAQRVAAYDADAWKERLGTCIFGRLGSETKG